MSSSKHPCSGATVDGRNPKQPPGMVQKPYEYWDTVSILHQLVNAGFLPLTTYVSFRDGISRHVFFHWQHPSPNWTWPHGSHGSLHGRPTSVSKSRDGNRLFLPVLGGRRFKAGFLVAALNGWEHVPYHPWDERYIDPYMIPTWMVDFVW